MTRVFSSIATSVIIVGALLAILFAKAHAQDEGCVVFGPGTECAGVEDVLVQWQIDLMSLCPLTAVKVEVGCVVNDDASVSCWKTCSEEL